MKIRTKNPEFTGTRAGIKFVNGVGETSDEKAIGQLKRLGYTVEDESDEDGEAPAGNASRDDWAAYAKSKGFDVLEDWKRDDIKALFQGEPEQD
ncbi:hypothetical protein [Brachybacterium massiliense]|uniref:hypothetical protein n=1 Tax=Brachybacterium massiliense TaxID=1755098 RepID=UPI000B3BB028|nr:hypothetical protein [Brachybacterium massiliense]